MLESRVESALTNAAKSAGGMAIKLTHQIGLPDRLVLLPGPRLIFVETKAPRRRPRASQIWWHEKLRALGFRVEVVDHPDQAREVCGV